MNNPRGAFFFRNRRWLLIALLIVAWALLPLSRDSTAREIARLAGHGGSDASVEFWEHACYALAAALVALGAFWRTWGSAYLGTNVVQDKRLHSERLVADGPYRRTRNPLYFGNMMLAAGLAILVNPMAGVIFVLGMWVLVRLFIRDEEAGFAESRGESYRGYRAAVPRLLPAWRPRIPRAGSQPLWVQGICGESVLWMFAILTAGYAATLGPIWYGRGLLWGLVLSFPLFLWARKRSRQTSGSA